MCCAGDNKVVRHICSNAGAAGCHNFPVGDINQNTVDKGPLFAHIGLHRMNGAQFIPEDAISVTALDKEAFFAGMLAEFSNKTGGWQT
jgi:hypothetical protein